MASHFQRLAASVRISMMEPMPSGLFMAKKLKFTTKPGSKAWQMI